MTLQTGSGDVDANIVADQPHHPYRQRDMELRLGNAPTLLIGHLRVRRRRHQGAGRSELRRDASDRVRRHGHRPPSQSTAGHRKIQVETGSGDISVSGR